MNGYTYIAILVSREDNGYGERRADAYRVTYPDGNKDLARWMHLHANERGVSLSNARLTAAQRAEGTERVVETWADDFGPTENYCN